MIYAFRALVEYANLHPDDPNAVAFLAALRELEEQLATIEWPPADG